jgi:hypothetical protein
MCADDAERSNGSSARLAGEGCGSGESGNNDGGNNDGESGNNLPPCGSSPSSVSREAVMRALREDTELCRLLLLGDPAQDSSQGEGGDSAERAATEHLTFELFVSECVEMEAKGRETHRKPLKKRKAKKQQKQPPSSVPSRMQPLYRPQQAAWRG